MQDNITPNFAKPKSRINPNAINEAKTIPKELKVPNFE